MKTALEWRRDLVARVAAGYPAGAAVTTYATGLAMLRAAYPVRLLGLWRAAALWRHVARTETRPEYTQWLPDYLAWWFEDTRPGRRPLDWYDAVRPGTQPQEDGVSRTNGDIVVACTVTWHMEERREAHTGWWYPAVAAALGVGLGFDPAWRTEAVYGLARSIVEDDRTELFPVLADALEDAGCYHPDLDRLRVADLSLTPADWWAWTAAYPVPPEEPVGTHQYAANWEMGPAAGQENRWWSHVIPAETATEGPVDERTLSAEDWSRSRFDPIGQEYAPHAGPEYARRWAAACDWLRTATSGLDGRGLTTRQILEELYATAPDDLKNVVDDVLQDCVRQAATGG